MLGNSLSLQTKTAACKAADRHHPGAPSLERRNRHSPQQDCLAPASVRQPYSQCNSARQPPGGYRLMQVPLSKQRLQTAALCPRWILVKLQLSAVKCMQFCLDTNNVLRITNIWKWNLFSCHSAKCHSLPEFIMRSGIIQEKNKTPCLHFNCFNSYNLGQI